ncbi:hypothetical protein [Nocardia asteroides]|uniref:Uncharacterized protein n=1 Tax=Nocardia asteroides NBRC 15531 TaxID=1110697 RepID=U5E336_NOCAS|nr:hypothetical protein [Nocardia asteroides]UGT50136.1 hypothetical protein LT345_05980 [Nocardia asteroides]GAD81847.1 hypothetical protein NCAST_05_02840 [Nocardia asteroides NBRC 15531]SFN20184.1 hypothetical protein SAMN05444423_10714 [Nocardia asteroides]VEG37096.1 Uncharacterised protein [Nocardia asteroides]
MAMPAWNDPKLGTMKACALWLVHEVGVGELFTKGQLRDAFPGKSQVDRRMRDLRDFGWRIDTNREDASLGPHEQRFVKQGVAVWEPGKATRPAGATITAAERFEVMVKDGRKCRSCGIGPGETYAGTYVSSQLDVARRAVRLPNGDTTVQMVLECSRCRIGGRDSVADLGDVLDRVDKLPAYEKQMLSQWIERDARGFSEAEDLWGLYRTLPAESRDEVRDRLK